MKFWFTCKNPNWVNNGERNVMFLMHMQNYLNDKLRARGYVTVAEVLEQIGINPIDSKYKGFAFNHIYNYSIEGTYVDFGLKFKNVRRAKTKFQLNINVEDSVYI